jgi:vacuolar-type H+-ATPase subunit H
MRRKEHKANSPAATLRWVPDEQRRRAERERERIWRNGRKNRKRWSYAGEWERGRERRELL